MLGLVFNAGPQGDRRRLRRGAAADRHARSCTPTTARCSRCRGRRPRPCMARHCPKSADLVFMTATQRRVRRHRLRRLALRLYRRGRLRDLGRRPSKAEAVVRALLAEPEVKPVGLGARDSLRLEAGLPLYGHDLDETTSPVEADLSFAIARRAPRRRRLPGRRAHPAASLPIRTVAQARRHQARRPRPGARRAPKSSAPTAPSSARSHRAASARPSTRRSPWATSTPRYAAPGTALKLRGRRGDEPATVAPLPFVPHRYVRTRS